MEKKLTDYILHLDNWIPKNISNKIIEELSDNKIWQKHQYVNSVTLENISRNNELEVCFLQELTYIKKLYELVWKGLEKYILIDKKGEDYFNQWKGFGRIRFNRYKKNQSISKHCDHIQSLFTGDRRGIPILSIVGVLNDDYKGGEFIMFDDYEIKFKAGDLIIFPSVFLYPHLVKPVKQGVRYSFVSWCY